MKNHFDQEVIRKGTDSRKWDLTGMLEMAQFVYEDSIPLWVADMDFKAPDFLVEALERRTKEGVYGYNIAKESYYEKIKFWQKSRNNWEIENEWIISNTGVVPAICYSIRSFTEEGDGIIIQNPVYPPFKGSIEVNNRRVVNNNLKFDGEKYSIDFEDLELKIKDSKNKMMILCNPHNPIGKVWTRDELEKVAKLCSENDVYLVSDEIHGDLSLFNNPFTSLGIVKTDKELKLIVCTSISKTFNCAGLRIANIIISNKEMRDRYVEEMTKVWEKPLPNMYGAVAIEALYTEKGEEWLEGLKEYLENNYIYLREFIENNFKNIKCLNLEGTYLAWIDLRKVNMDYYKIKEKLEKEVKIVVDGGEIFGEEGEGFIRLNFACHRDLLKEVLLRLKNAFLED